MSPPPLVTPAALACDIWYPRRELSLRIALALAGLTSAAVTFPVTPPPMAAPNLD